MRWISVAACTALFWSAGGGHSSRSEEIHRREAPTQKRGTSVLEDDFATAPRWDEFRNRLLPEQLPIVRQDFGFQISNRAGGRSAGEIGGTIERSTTKASYARSIPELTLNDRLSAAGRLSVTLAGGSSGVMFGWFNHSSRGWRTPNSLAFRIDGNGDKFWLFYEYGTTSGRTGGGGAFEGERYQTTPTAPFPADGRSHEWSLDYDPSAEDGRGQISFRIDDRKYVLPLALGHKDEGAHFDRFGFWNVQIEGNSMDVFIDDLVVNGQPWEFEDDPGWEEVGNSGEFTESVIRPHHDFGYSQTNFAGGETPGEIGGIVFRDERPAFYAATVEPSTLDDELVASGKIALLEAASDSGVYLGWFSADSKKANETPEHEARQKNFLAVMIEGPSRVGHYFRPAYATAAGKGSTSGPNTATGSVPPVIHPDGSVHTWWIRYSPRGNGGGGRITVRLDDETFTQDLLPEHRGGPTKFDRFGLFNVQSGGHHVRLYIDDLSVSSQGTQQQALD